MPGIGERVHVRHLGCSGAVRFAGEVPGLPGDWVGVELDEPKGSSNGKLVGKQLFTCADNHGVFLRENALAPEAEAGRLTPPPPVSPHSLGSSPRSGYSDVSPRTPTSPFSRDSSGLTMGGLQAVTKFATKVSRGKMKGINRVRAGPSVPAPVQTKKCRGPAVVSSFNAYLSKLDQCSEREFIEQDGELNVVETFKIRGSQSNLSRNRKEIDDYEERLLAEEIPADHAGPQLAWPPTEESLGTLLEHLKCNCRTTLHRSYVAKALVGARELYSKGSSSLLEIEVDSGNHQKLIVVGDLHGQINDLLWILHIHGLPNPAGAQYLFNGDFVDRGEYGMEVLTLLCTMKCLWPNSVHLNRGNHETLNANIAYGFAPECIHKYSNEMMQICQWLFEALPLVHIVTSKEASAWATQAGYPTVKIMVVHGGLPRRDKVTLEDISEIFRFQDIPTRPKTEEAELLFDLLWADPLETRGREKGARGPSTWQFGPDVTRQFCIDNKLSMVLRSHELPENGDGYKLQHDGRLATVFSASNYCGQTGNMGAVVILGKDLSVEPVEHFAPMLDTLKDEMAAGITDSVAHAEAAMCKVRQAQFMETLPAVREVLVLKKKDLKMWYQGIVKKGQKLIPLKTWAEGLVQVVGLDLNWMEYQPHLAAVDNDGMIDWQAFLDRYQIRVGSMLHEWAQSIRRQMIQKLVGLNLSLRGILELFDPDGSGYIDDEELRQVLGKINIKPTLEQVHELTYDLKKNEKGEVDVHAFIESLQCEYKGQASETADDKSKELLRQFGMMLHGLGDRLVDLFEAFDTSGDGKVDYDEFLAFAKALLVQSGAPGRFTDDELRQIVRVIDKSGSGDICFIAFVDAFAKPKEHGEKIVAHICQSLMRHRIGLERAFFLLDMDGDGYLTAHEFQEGMITLNLLMDGNFQLSDQDIESLVKHLDEDGNGSIDYHEFCNAFSAIDVEASAPTRDLSGLKRPVSQNKA